MYRGWFGQEIARGYHRVRYEGRAPSPQIEQLETILAAARKGKVRLLCHCAPKACHAAVIAEYVRGRIGREIAVTLTPAQRRVFDLLGRGFEAKAIGRALGSSHFTVTNHTRVILAAFGAATRGEIIALFASPPPPHGSF